MLNGSRFLRVLKTILGAPVPYLLAGYVLSLLSSMAGMEILGWLTAAFTLVYILVDRFSSEKEFKFYWLGPDLFLIGFCVSAAVGLSVSAPGVDFWMTLGKFRWVILLYLLTYSMDLFPPLNRLLMILIYGGTLVAGYAIFQHFTGIDFRYEFGLRSESAVTPAPFSGSDVFQSVGLFSHHLTYGYSFGMLVCFPMAAALIYQRRSAFIRWGSLLAVAIIGLSLYWTYGRGVWIATAAAFGIMALCVSKRYFFGTLLTGAGIFAASYATSDGFRERFTSIWDQNFFSNVERKNVWKANLQMFYDHPWFGIGLGQNEARLGEYYQRLGVQSEFGGHAHNNYFQYLATTGIVGFACYMIFILTLLLATQRLWSEIPRTHFWHRVIALGALGAQVSMHVGGLTQWNFGDAEVNHMFVFIAAVILYLNERYGRGIVPDDYAL